MKKIILLTVFCSNLSLAALAQRVRVYEHLQVNTQINKSLNPSAAYTQSLVFGDLIAMKVISGVRMSMFNHPNNDMPLTRTSDSKSTLRFVRPGRNLSINAPIGIEAGFKYLSIGVNADLVGFTMGSARDTTYFTASQPTTGLQDLVVDSGGFNFLFSKRGNINSELYGALTIGDALTVRFGVAGIRRSYTGRYLVSADRTTTWHTFTRHDFRPFVGLQFNFER